MPHFREFQPHIEDSPPELEYESLSLYSRTRIFRISADGETYPIYTKEFLIFCTTEISSNITESGISEFYSIMAKLDSALPGLEYEILGRAEGENINCKIGA